MCVGNTNLQNGNESNRYFFKQKCDLSFAESLQILHSRGHSSRATFAFQGRRVVMMDQNDRRDQWRQEAVKAISYSLRIYLISWDSDKSSCSQSPEGTTSVVYIISHGSVEFNHPSCFLPPCIYQPSPRSSNRSLPPGNIPII